MAACLKPDYMKIFVKSKETPICTWYNISIVRYAAEPAPKVMFLISNRVIFWWFSLDFPLHLLPTNCVALWSIDRSGAMTTVTNFTTPLRFLLFLRTVLTLSWLFNFTLMGLRCFCLFPPILLNSITVDFAQTASNTWETAFVKSSFVSPVSQKNYQIRFLSSSPALNLVTLFCFSGLTLIYHSASLQCRSI